MYTFPSYNIWLQHRISYGETDAMNVVYYANYLHLFERSRNELIRSCGMSYREVESQGFYLPVREASCRYKSPLRYDDLIHIRTGISEWGRASITFVYEIYDEAKARVHATGFTQHACVNTEGKPVAVPAFLKQLLGNNC